MIGQLLCSLACGSAVVEVRDLALEDLLCAADVVAIARVERIEALARDPTPEREELDFGWRFREEMEVAELTIERLIAGDAPLSSLLYFASSTWTCDITGASVGERVLLFAERGDLPEQAGERFLESAERVYGSRDVLEDVLWGRGYMPIRLVEGEQRVLYWPEVLLPGALLAASRPAPEDDVVRSLPLAAMVGFLLDELPRQRALFLEAHDRGSTGAATWTLRLRRDRRFESVCESPLGRRVVEGRIDSREFFDLRDALERRARGALRLGPEPAVRGWTCYGPSLYCHVELGVLEHEFPETYSEAEIREQVHALRKWSRLLEAVGPAGCAELTPSERSLLQR